MLGRLPLPHLALAVTLGVASGLYIYRPVFQSPGPPQPPEGTAGPPAAAAPEKRP
ncbi:protein PIGBOS1-like [Falco biarmicus]|uniref:protein PIGBOS1-like n=1 Tax=Falco rusticolus TaxID=120794 RepID=UPI00188699D8|nr:protein PIGBOS1-like [Falco rusticolus]XP_055664962.1 protein PIGBOS1-like [Falco peregrinus]XP_056201111.1 protein PIGBOS1-like [Falco biarmicus]